VFQPLSKSLNLKRKIAWDEVDTRHFIQAWLRDKTKTNNLHCESLKRGIATVRAESPAVRMMVKLLEYDLQQELKEQDGPKLKDIRVRW